MRKNLILFILIVCSAIFMAAMCNKEEEREDDSRCVETEKPEISRSFVISAYIYYKDDVPYEGDVHFKIKKQYCDNTISGEYYLDHIPSSSNGGWFSGMVYSYYFANSEDRVVVTITWATGSKDLYEWFDYLYYDEVVNVSSPMEITYDITLPYNSPGGKK